MVASLLKGLCSKKVKKFRGRVVLVVGNFAGPRPYGCPKGGRLLSRWPVSLRVCVRPSEKSRERSSRVDGGGIMPGYGASRQGPAGRAQRSGADREAGPVLSGACPKCAQFPLAERDVRSNPTSHSTLQKVRKKISRNPSPPCGERGACKT